MTIDPQKLAVRRPITHLGSPAPMSEHAARALTAALHQVARVQRFALPQTWTIGDLAERYHGLGPGQIKELARLHAGYQPRPGKPFLLSLRQVEQLDAAIEGVCA